MTMSQVDKDACKEQGESFIQCSGNETEVDSPNGSDFTLEEYQMNHKHRGQAHIFNHENFDNKRSRPGTQQDRDKLKQRFEELNFDVQVHQDLLKKDVLAKIAEAAKSSHVDADCFMCVFLSHGEKDKVWARDKEISIDEVTASFKRDKCRSLVGKPKIFIIQACRGNEFDEAATGMAGDSDEEEDNGVFCTLPAGADFLICYSVAVGYFSFRDPNKGSWYIQDLCEALHQCGGSLEFTELLTLVNSKVAKRYVEKSRNKNAIGKKQIPCFVSMLTKKLYFRPKQ